MKKISYAIFIFLLTISTVIAISCNNDLAAPDGIFVTTDNFLKWNKVKNAEKYIVSIDEKDYTTENTEIDLFDKCLAYKKFLIKVVAVGKNYVLSEAADFEYEISKPEGLTVKVMDNKECILQATNETKLPAKLLIPQYANGLPITRIAPSCFKNFSKLTAVYIPDTITNIGSAAFENCTNLQKVRLPLNLEIIQNNCFQHCKNLKEITLPESIKEIRGKAFFDCNGLSKLDLPINLQKLDMRGFPETIKELFIPKNVNYIEPCGINFDKVTVDKENCKYYSADNCILNKADDMLLCGNKIIPNVVTALATNSYLESNITEIIIPENVKTIYSGAFNVCNKLESVVIGEGVETIYPRAFYICGNLKKLEFSSTVRFVADDTIFMQCDAIEEITFSPKNKKYDSVNNYIFDKETNTLIGGILKERLPDNISKIGKYAFARQKGLESLIIPSNVKTIDDYAFSDCTALKRVILESGITTIGNNAFYNCKGIEEVYLPSSLESIETSSFANTFNTPSITLPEGLKVVKANAFSSIKMTVYLPKNTDTSNWAKESIKDFVHNESWSNGCSVLLCDIKYDGDYPYVDAIYKTLTTRENIEAPYRMGYTFKGWSLYEHRNTIDYPVSLIEAHYNDYAKIIITDSYVVPLPFNCDSKGKEAEIVYAVWEKD